MNVENEILYRSFRAVRKMLVGQVHKKEQTSNTAPKRRSAVESAATRQQNPPFSGHDSHFKEGKFYGSFLGGSVFAREILSPLGKGEETSENLQRRRRRILPSFGKKILIPS